MKEPEERTPKEGPSPPRFSRLIFVVLVAYLLVQLGQGWSASADVATVPYSRFEEWLDDGRVARLEVSSRRIEGELREPGEDEPARFRTNLVDPALVERLREQDLEYTGVVEDTLLRDAVGWVLPLLVIVALWMWVFRRFAGGAGSGFLSVGKSKARVYMEESVPVRFGDVAGVDEAKEELAEVIGFLTDPERHGRLGGRLPKGILLVGPPGTGKTLLARAVAGEAGVPFFSISGSEFVEMFVGVGAARVRDLFEQARQRAPCIIFIDELDALGRARGLNPMTGGHDEKEQTLNQLLSELDGFDPSHGVVLLSATNRPEVLDPALLRAGRFDRQILVDRPDRPARAKILLVHVRHVELGDDVDVDDVAGLTPGFTGADLANLVNEAAILATRRGADRVEMSDFTAAIERIVAGLEKRSRILNPKERRVTAYHEMGHALVAHALAGADRVHKVSIIPRGIGALGYTIQRPLEDRFLMTRGELETKMAVLLAGRAAEEITFGEMSTGAADDFAKCTDIARGMVMRFGMTEKLGLVTYEPERATFLVGAHQPALPRHFSEHTSRLIDRAVRELMDGAHERALAILRRRRADLDRGAERLLEQETLTAEDLASIVGPTPDAAEPEEAECRAASSP